MPMLAEHVDAVIGGDTHRDTHALEMTTPTGATIATLVIENSDDGFTEAIAWIADTRPVLASSSDWKERAAMASG